jgi:hypothetical protein
MKKIIQPLQVNLVKEQEARNYDHAITQSCLWKGTFVTRKAMQSTYVITYSSQIILNFVKVIIFCMHPCRIVWHAFTCSSNITSDFSKNGNFYKIPIPHKIDCHGILTLLINLSQICQAQNNKNGRVCKRILWTDDTSSFWWKLNVFRSKWEAYNVRNLLRRTY